MALPKALFWWDWVNKMVLDSFWWVILFIFVLWVPFLRVWWWFFLPLMLQSQLKKLYIWWISWDYDYAKAKWVMLEIIPPKEVLVPHKAMEDVFNLIWGIWDSPNFREKWCDGELDNGPFWASFEIVSTEGRLHFYLRLLAGQRTMVEAAIYGHYPSVEIHETSDYTKLVPQTIPNNEWDMYGEDWELNKPAVYPIKTFEKFFEPQGERITAEEKRLDPILSLLESMSKLGPGEHYWVQFITTPIRDKDEPGWKKEGEKIINKITKRPEKVETTLVDDIMFMLKSLVMGPEKEGSGDKASYKWTEQTKTETGEREMVLTPGEREVLTEIENKMKKPVFRVTMRGVYVARREKWTSPNRILMRAYAGHFATDNLNSFKFNTLTRPRIHYFWRKRRVFLRARRMFRMSVLRLPPLFPKRSSADVQPILSAEEMATLFHFPVRTSGMIAPTMGKVETKKGGPPPNLPIE
jgi:hypothetical protein